MSEFTRVGLVYGEHCAYGSIHYAYGLEYGFDDAYGVIGYAFIQGQLLRAAPGAWAGVRRGLHPRG